MQSEQSKQISSINLLQVRSIGQELRNSVLPQIKGLLSDAETVLRNETRLLEAHFFDRVKKLETRILLSTIGAAALFLSLGLFVFTIVFEVIETFPGVPIWAITGLMSVVICIFGGFLLSRTSSSQISNGK